MHDAELAHESFLGQGFNEAAKIAFDHRLHIGRKGRRRGALILPEFAGDFMTAGNTDLRIDVAYDTRDRFLVRRVEIAIEKTDRDGVEIALSQCCFNDHCDCLFVQDTHNIAIRFHAFRYL